MIATAIAVASILSIQFDKRELAIVVATLYSAAIVFAAWFVFADPFWTSGPATIGLFPAWGLWLCFFTSIFGAAVGILWDVTTRTHRNTGARSIKSEAVTPTRSTAP